jgi:hypothetical protein
MTAQTFTAQQVDEMVAQAVQDTLKLAAFQAKNAIQNWAADLQGTHEAYLDALKSGTLNNRRISPEMAKSFAREFKFRSDAVYDCADMASDAILKPKKMEAEK